MFGRKFLRNTARGGLALGLAAVALEEAMFNMEHSGGIWRLDSPLPWIVVTPFLIVSIYYFFSDDEDKKECANANKR